MLYTTVAQDFSSTKIKKSVLVNTSYKYNGGINIDGKHYEGYDCPPPILPEGCELKSLCGGLDLNSTPPQLLMRLVKIA